MFRSFTYLIEVRQFYYFSQEARNTEMGLVFVEYQKFETVVDSIKMTEIIPIIKYHSSTRNLK
jgi:hypothetical protein